MVRHALRTPTRWTVCIKPTAAMTGNRLSPQGSRKAFCHNRRSGGCRAQSAHPQPRVCWLSSAFLREGMLGRELGQNHSPGRKGQSFCILKITLIYKLLACSSFSSGTGSTAPWSHLTTPREGSGSSRRLAAEAGFKGMVPTSYHHSLFQTHHRGGETHGTFQLQPEFNTRPCAGGAGQCEGR